MWFNTLKVPPSPNLLKELETLKIFQVKLESGLVLVKLEDL
tara:strand:- start:172 stop:294 length:123 start_codon:yes stop_codon:yes gene_type:complete